MEETRKLLKLFGVAVTDFETAAEKLAAEADPLAALARSTEMCRELNRRWLDVTTHVFAAQDRFLAALGEAAARKG